LTELGRRDGVGRRDVTVIIPTRDRHDELRTAVHSALTQRAVEVEIVVVDDGSVEPAQIVLHDLDDGRIRVVRNTSSLGETATRNRGIAEASGAWVAFLDDDDLWSPDKVARQLDALEREDAGWAYAGDVVVDEQLRPLHGAPPPSPLQIAGSLRRYNSVPAGASNVIVRASVLAAVGPFDPALRRTGDWDMWLRLLATGLPACVPEPLVANRVHRGNVSRDMQVLFEELPLIARRHRITVDVARHYRWAAWAARVEGRRKTAIGYYARAVAHGDIASIGRAAVSAVTPPPRPRETSARDDGWLRQAQGWLRPFLPPSPPSG
jgi:glycosyltransferase involved in cell wall biosynthesis